MLIQSCWLPSLLFIVSATVSAQLTTTLLYPIANGTSIPTSSIDPTSSILPAATTSTAAPLPTSSSFYLVVADTGTSLDGDYLSVGEAFSGDGIFVLLFGAKEPDPYEGDIFSLSNATYGNLIYNPSGNIATYYDLYGGIIFQDPDPAVAESYGDTPATCELADGDILCQNTEYSTFYTYPSTVVDGADTVPYVELGPLPIPSGAVRLNLLPVPVD